MGDRLPRRMTDLQAMTGGRGRSSTTATIATEDKPGEEVSLLEAAVSRLTAAETPTPDGAAATSSSTSSRLSMLILPRVERLEESVRSVKKDLGMGESRLYSIYRNPNTIIVRDCLTRWIWRLMTCRKINVVGLSRFPWFCLVSRVWDITSEKQPMQLQLLLVQWAQQANPVLSMNNCTPLVISTNDKNKLLTLLGQYKLAFTAGNTFVAI
jgi:hypothetical protein